MVQSRNLASGVGEKLRREHVPAAAGARWGEGQPSGTQDYDDPAKLAVVRLGRRCRGIEQSVRSPMKLRSFSCEWRGTSSPFFKYTCAIIIRSPVTRRRVIVPLSDSSGMRSQRRWLTLLKSARPMNVPSSETLGVDRYVERRDETVGFVYQATIASSSEYWASVMPLLRAADCWAPVCCRPEVLCNCEPVGPREREPLGLRNLRSA